MPQAGLNKYRGKTRAAGYGDFPQQQDSANNIGTFYPMLCERQDPCRNRSGLKQKPLPRRYTMSPDFLDALAIEFLSY